MSLRPMLGPGTLVCNPFLLNGGFRLRHSHLRKLRSPTTIALVAKGPHGSSIGATEHAGWPFWSRNIRCPGNTHGRVSSGR
jgi:hypothetical protein